MLACCRVDSFQQIVLGVAWVKRYYESQIFWTIGVRLQCAGIATVWISFVVRPQGA